MRITENESAKVKFSILITHIVLFCFQLLDAFCTLPFSRTFFLFNETAFQSIPYLYFNQSYIFCNAIHFIILHILITSAFWIGFYDVRILNLTAVKYHILITLFLCIIHLFLTLFTHHFTSKMLRITCFSIILNC